jgi:acetyl-CoA acyltransferase
MGKASDSAFSSSNAEIYDTTIGWRFVNALMKQQYGIDAMPETAENVAAEFQVGRADQDAFAYRSQQRWGAAKAAAAGFQARRDRARRDSPPKKRQEPKTFDTDEHPPSPTPRMERAGQAQDAVQRNPELTVTAGNASGVNDGACGVDHRLRSRRHEASTA